MSVDNRMIQAILIIFVSNSSFHYGKLFISQIVHKNDGAQENIQKTIRMTIEISDKIAF